MAIAHLSTVVVVHDQVLQTPFSFYPIDWKVVVVTEDGSPVRWKNVSEMTDQDKITFLMNRTYKFLARIKELENIIAQLNCAPGKVNDKLQKQFTEISTERSKLSSQFNNLSQAHESLKKEVEVLRGIVKKADEIFYSDRSKSQLWELSKRKVSNE